MVSAVPVHDSVTYTSKGIHVVTIDFIAIFCENVVKKDYKVYCKQIVPSILLPALNSYNQRSRTTK